MKTLLLAIILFAFAGTASANTPRQALDASYSSADLFRPTGTPNNIWNNPIPAGTPVDPNSAIYTSALRQSMGINADGTLVPNSGGRRWRNVYILYVADAATPYKAACSRYVLNGKSWSWNRSFHEATVVDKVPVPPGALAYDGGADHSMSIYSPSTNTYWDFYRGLDPAPAGTKDPQGRTCDYLYEGGGRIRSIGTMHGAVKPLDASPGYFRNNPPTEERMWGRQATALPVIGGAITPQEWDNPSDTKGFGHALSIPVPFGRCGPPWWPAVRNDCGAGGSVPEGALLRFAANTDCTMGTASLFWRRVRGLCVAFRDWGAYVVDQTWNGAAWKQRNGTFTPDAPTAANPNASHWPNEYWEAMKTALVSKMQVTAIQPHVEWSVGCLC